MRRIISDLVIAAVTGRAPEPLTVGYIATAYVVSGIVAWGIALPTLVGGTILALHVGRLIVRLLG